MGVEYDRADKTRHYVETPDIKMKRPRYLQERYAAKYKDALFVWLDESYIHHHHLHNKVVGTLMLACTALASADFPATELCIHADCVGFVNYCVERYSYVKVDDAGTIDSKLYLVPQDTTKTESFNGNCAPFEGDIPFSQYCIHEECLGPVSYCDVRYSYVDDKTAGNVDSRKYLVPQDTTMTESFNGKCPAKCDKVECINRNFGNGKFPKPSDCPLGYTIYKNDNCGGSSVHLNDGGWTS
ncbi:hypothetical protein BGZ75_009073, partial [Mortierella antarctica]